jgi:hypothetical protein
VERPQVPVLRRCATTQMAAGDCVQH